ncbi:flavo-diiron protein FprA1 [Anaerotignum neopropionicum]|uniref:Flavo-diiron protein FprA1 n=1 Tax=Anaerotignum neopropionicum TaxID=36847 RepID=A0A136WHT4_9FIRM|nr:FAD-dependent oxidoreductase [Anaerotignum neopropionicum]KXL54126.1 flavo-diiron protein FprA1 [Anaerotignum neopropionicum]
MKTLQLKDDLYWAGILDKDLRVFDIIMHTEFGTTYNSYILKCGDKTVLFETAKAKFFGEYEKALSEKLDIEKIDYIVVDHTEPDHAGSIRNIIEKCPRAKIIATPTAIGFLKQIVNRDFYSIPVKDKVELPIGNKTLRFYVLPNLHWPDSMYTYIVEDKVLVTCDSFGSHYAHDGILRSTVTDEEGYMRATKYYFDNILGPFKQPYMTNALDVVKSLDIDMICTGHGPVLDSHIEELIQIYEDWCKVPVNEKTTVVMPYVSAYGYTGELAEKIAQGIRASGEIDVKIYDMVTADPAVVLGEIALAKGFLLGTPTILGDALKPIWDLTTSLFAPVHGGKLASAFGSYGWSGEGVPHLIERLKQLNMRVMDGFRVQFKPSEKELLEAFEFGYQFGEKLQKKDAPPKSGARSTLVKCLVCGEILDSSLDRCPVCGVGPENFAPIEVESVSFYKDSMEKYIILGGGTAALNGAKAIRERNKTASITMISEEGELPYDRPMLTKNMFGALSGDAIASEERAWYEDNHVALKLDTRVVKIDTQKKEIFLSNGEVLPYDKCIYALGSYSFVPPIKGKDLEGVTAIRTILDVEKVSLWAHEAKSAVVIGGGVLGLEAAWELRKEKLEVTVLEGAPVLMAGKIDKEAVDMLTKIADDEGIRIVTGAKISEISGNGRVDSVVLEGGESIPADLVIISTGVRANIALAADAGIICERAVVVDEGMRTNNTDIFACGDCAQYQGMNIAIWPVAAEMGRIAGANAAGDNLSYAQKTYGITLAALGTMLFAMGDVGSKEDMIYKTMEIKDERKGILEKYYFLNSTLCGAILLGDTSKIAKVTEAIEEKKSFTEFFK